MLKQFKNPIALFFLKFGTLYLVWFLFYDVWLRSPKENVRDGEITIENSSSIDIWMIEKTTSVSVSTLKKLGHDVFYDGARTFGIVGSNGLWVGDSCNAISLIALFSGIMICLSGKWWIKLVYIFIGGIIIWLMNVIRLVVLAILSSSSPESIEFNHTYTFTIFIYCIIIFMWYFWIKKFADLDACPEEK
jgi:exosortase family protein XrtF